MIDNPSCPLAAEFLSLLVCLGLQQHVEDPTHNKGHILYLEITNSTSIKTLEVYDLGVSDHKVVSMTLTSLLPPSRPKRQISFRNLKRIVSVDMVTAYHLLPLKLDELVEHYNTSLSSVLDLHAPVKTREVMFERSAPCYTQELRTIKTAGRVLEHQFRHTGLTTNLPSVSIKKPIAKP